MPAARQASVLSGPELANDPTLIFSSLIRPEFCARSKLLFFYPFDLQGAFIQVSFSGSGQNRTRQKTRIVVIYVLEKSA